MVVSAAFASSEKAAYGGVESERANESAEEDDEDESGVGFEIFGAGIMPPPDLMISFVGC